MMEDEHLLTKSSMFTMYNTNATGIIYVHYYTYIYRTQIE